MSLSDVPLSVIQDHHDAMTKPKRRTGGPPRRGAKRWIYRANKRQEAAELRRKNELAGILATYERKI